MDAPDLASADGEIVLDALEATDAERLAECYDEMTCWALGDIEPMTTAAAAAFIERARWKRSRRSIVRLWAIRKAGDRRLVGWTELKPGGAESVFLTVVVHPDHRRERIGTRATEAMVAEAFRDDLVGAVFVETRHGHTASQLMAIGVGFEATDTIKTSERGHVIGTGILTRTGWLSNRGA